MVLCDVYKSSKKSGLFVYVNRAEGLARVPEDLLAQFGEPSVTLSFKLHETRRMAQQDPVVIMANLETHGYYVQLPPLLYHFGNSK